MHSSALGTTALMALRSLSSAVRLSTLKAARYSPMVIAPMVRAPVQECRDLSTDSTDYTDFNKGRWVSNLCESAKSVDKLTGIPLMTLRKPLPPPTALQACRSLRP